MSRGKSAGQLARETRRVNSVSASGRARAARLPASERREQLLDAATRVFSSKSYTEVGTAEIARAAGVSEPTLYRYFESKHALYLAMLDRNADAILKTWREIAGASATPIDALRSVGRWYFQQLVADPGRFLLRARALLETDREVAEHARERFLQTFEFVRGLYEDALRAGVIDASTDTRAYAWVFMSLGALLDQALLMNLGRELDVVEMRRIMGVIGPVLLVPEGGALPSGKPGRKELTHAKGGRGR
jgi:AcrR family transcriptional regulator